MGKEIRVVEGAVFEDDAVADDEVVGEGGGKRERWRLSGGGERERGGGEEREKVGGLSG